MRRSYVVVVVVVAGMVVAFGFAHLTHGSSAGMTLCAKQSWSLSDTIIDVGDYVDQPALMLAGKERVVVDLAKCGLIRVPAIERGQLEIFVKNQAGSRMRIEPRDDGATIAIIGDSVDCDRLQSIFAAYPGMVPARTKVVCDTNLRIVWSLREADGRLR